jgi:hypothetical protein
MYNLPQSIATTSRVISNPNDPEAEKIVIRNLSQHKFQPVHPSGPLTRTYVSSDPIHIRNEIKEFGFVYLADSIDVLYNLLWHIYQDKDIYDGDRLRAKIGNRALTYISGLSANQLLKLFPITYYGATDRASLLYAAVSGKLLPVRNLFTPERYYEVAQYPTLIVWRLALFRYHITELTSDDPAATYTPYELVAIYPKDAIEEIYTIATVDNLAQLIDQYQVVIFPLNSRGVRRTKEVMLELFLIQIAGYDRVFSRPADILPPPPISQANKDQLEQYTTKELIDAYEPPLDRWETRDQLIDLYLQGNRGGAKWSWRHLRCKNDNTRNIFEYTFHGEMNKDDPNDPTLSYGVLTNYRCYQIGELIDVFSRSEGFLVPDITPEDAGIDPSTELEYSQEFPISSIQQLRELLNASPTGYNLGNLPALIDEKLKELIGENAKLRKMKREYDRFTPEQQYLINLFVTWLFFYGMWMRFWKGPGYEWPYDSHISDICIPITRDQHIRIQHIVLDVLTENYKKDYSVTQWINSLPMLRFNYVNRQITPLNQTVMHILQEYLEGRSCMGIGGDIFVQTGYVIITQLLNFDKEGEFDNFIATMLPPLLDIERQVVNNRLDEYGENLDPDEYQTLIERRDALNRPLEPLPHFDPIRVQPNKHT